MDVVAGVKSSLWQVPSRASTCRFIMRSIDSRVCAVSDKPVGGLHHERPRGWGFFSMQLSLNVRQGSFGRWMIYCTPAMATEPELGPDVNFGTLEELAAALDEAGINRGRYGPTIRAVKDGYGAGFLVSRAEAAKLELLDT